MSMTIDGEPAFPVYPVKFRFHYPIPDRESVKDYGPQWFEGLSDGRMWGGNSFDYMVASERPVKHLIHDLTEANLAPYAKQHAGLDGWEVSVKEPYPETWVLTWFCHHTIDVGQDDLAVLASFERFVNRSWVAGKQLMGADDRYRWRGENEGDPAPCRCDGCRKHGLIRINH